MQYYVYTIKCTKRNEIIYVGITSNPEERFNTHTKSRQTELSEYLVQVIYKGFNPIFELIDKLDEYEARKLEKELIIKYHNQGNKLFNKGSVPKPKINNYTIIDHTNKL